MRIHKIIILFIITTTALSVWSKPTALFDERPNAVSYAAFIAEFHLNVNQGNPDPFIRNFHFSNLTNRIVSKLPKTFKDHNGLQADIQVSVKSMAEKIIQGKVKVLRITEKLNSATMLIRLDYGTDGLMYIRFDLAKHQGKIRIIDWHNHSTGMSLSETIQELYRMQHSLPKKQAAALNRFYVAVQTNQFKDALSTLESLPKKIRNNPLVLLLQAEASTMDEDLYMNSLANFAKRYGKQKRYTWIMIDHYYYQKDFKKAHELLNQFAKLVIADAAIYAIQGSFAYVINDYQSAIDHCQTAIKIDPDYRDTYLTLLYALIASHNYEEAVLVLRILQKRFEFQLDPMVLSSFEGFDDFSRSDAFMDWAEKTMMGVDRN